MLLFFPAPPETGENTVWLDTLLDNVTTKVEGFSPYRKVDALFGNRAVKHGLSTEIAFHGSIQARYSSVTFSLDKRYEKFEALIGRDNAEAALGQSYCFFEVYADGKRVYFSPAMRSPLSDVAAGGGDAHKVKAPQNVSLDVKGVELLRLVVQLPNFSQRGERVNRAAGCVWGEARLTLKPGARPEIVVVPPEPDAPVRAALRRAVTKLIPRFPDTTGEAQRLAVAPVQLDEGAPVTAELYEFVKLQLGRHGSARALVSLLEGGDEKAFLARLNGKSRPSELAAAARNAGADLILVPALISDNGWHVELRLLESGDGATLSSVRIALTP